MASIMAPWSSDCIFRPNYLASRLQQKPRAGFIKPLRAVAVEDGPDLFLLDLAEKLEDNKLQNTENEALKALHESSSELAVACKWPSKKDEAYRFTDVKFLKSLEIRPPAGSNTKEGIMQVGQVDGDSVTLVFIDGIYSPTLSTVNGLPHGVYVGSIFSAPEESLRDYVLPRLTKPLSLSENDAFASLNGVGALDVGVIVVPHNVKLQQTIHIVYYSSHLKNSDKNADGVISMSNPRLLVVANEGSEVRLVEEFVGTEGQGPNWTNSVCEIAIGSGASVFHDLVQTQNRSSVNVKKTYVSQEKGSVYKCVEVELGGKLSRHNLHIEQLGSDTSTEVLTFLLCGHDQLQDLNSKLVLNHPRGFARQLHKCIVMNSTGHGVFDGTIRVNRDAQQTDAGQLSRSLLLAPRATVNAKPSLQINADDVRCTHGVAISDLEDEQLFYFRARGINEQAARGALVFSFGAEVIERLECRNLQVRVEKVLKSLLASEGVYL